MRRLGAPTVCLLAFAATIALLAAQRAFGQVAPGAVERGVPTARNVDHVGLSVPNLEQATRFFVDVLGAEVLMNGGPWSDPKGGAFARVLSVDRRASIKVAMLRVGPVTSVELVEFTVPHQRRVMPKASDWGAAHLALFVDDIDAAAASLRARGVKVLEGPITNGPGPIEGSRYIYFMTPWGMPMELEQRSGALPYEGPGRHPYGPAPGWNWRPQGEAESETTVIDTLMANSSPGADLCAALDRVGAMVRKMPGTFEYRWLRSGVHPRSFVAYGRFADAASAASAGEAARATLGGFGSFSNDVLTDPSSTTPGRSSQTGSK